ncbi:MAG: ATP-binding cassette domain-containing protein [Alphaproteobacteria bacterium]|nr:ATP-binding cassette domain-containing protein [Alphaproteobacteria bacterium]MBO7536895.1 ATP-binding cassette domain-containing protein [Alphaproteobacteria bacterium]MBO7641957.1 ATP-binding cassette domain-containing protein [Alphaproteobacteria bacterium]
MTSPIIKAQNLSIGYDNHIIMDRLCFEIKRGDIFIIMGGSGCGKSTLLRTMIGLLPALNGHVLVNGIDVVTATENKKKHLVTQCGILYQSGALFSSMSLFENVALPLEQYTSYSERKIREIVRFKLALVGLAGFEDFYPSEISGGMRKRAGLARALALDPEIVFFDEPSAGLDPVSSKHLDDLILEINKILGMTIVVVTHELSSLFNIGRNCIFLDSSVKTISARGNPNDLLKNPPNERVLAFLTRGMSNEKRS